jgi:hypothetical protein
VSPVLDTLLSRLSVRGLPPEHVPGLVREVFRVVAEGGSFTSGPVNSRLERLEWGKTLLDETTLQLVSCLLHTECGYRGRRYAVESKRARSSRYPSKYSRSNQESDQ